MKLNNTEKLLIAAGVLLAIIVIVWIGMRPGNGNLPPLDPYDQKSVALHFIFENAKIGKQMGKIVRASLIGNGGSVPVSFNVFHLTGDNNGKQTSGVCNITLKRDYDNKYVVTDVILTIEGNEYKIPVEGLKSRGKGFRIFR